MPEEHTIFVFLRMWSLMAASSQGSSGFIPTGLGLRIIIVTEGSFSYSVLALVILAATAIFKEESYLWQSLEYRII